MTMVGDHSGSVSQWFLQNFSPLLSLSFFYSPLCSLLFSSFLFCVRPPSVHAANGCIYRKKCNRLSCTLHEIVALCILQRAEWCCGLCKNAEGRGVLWPLQKCRGLRGCRVVPALFRCRNSARTCQIWKNTIWSSNV